MNMLHTYGTSLIPALDQENIRTKVEVISAFSTQELEAQLMKKLNDGWVMGPLTSHLTDYGSIEFVQILTKQAEL